MRLALSTMDVLTADRGNTTLDLCLWRESGPAARVRFSVADGRRADGLGSFLDRVGCGTRCFASTVVPGGLDALLGECHARGIHVLRAGEDLPCPLETEYAEPSTLGRDRWLGALGGLHWVQQQGSGGPDYLVTVDVGTAATINLVGREGVFLGGAIALGPAAWVRALASAAPELPQGDLTGPAPMPATTSPDAVRAGIQRGVAGAIDRLVADALAGCDAELADARVLVTGGDAVTFLRWTTCDSDHVPDLVHRGLLALGNGGWRPC